ncbi:MAG: DegT/DnrJ/EryC1/StrS aminotransferase [Frankiales bacterium]|nr:DegT/DnrJ/EryC1/StrS aminotransferase [Frankiales bacterium]
MTDVVDLRDGWLRPAPLDPVPFHVASIEEDDIAAVVAVLRSGWLTTGPVCRAFEEAFARTLGDGVEALAVNSGTSALHLALEALGVGPGDYVLTPSYTFTATAEVVRYLGAHPLLVDVDERTGNLTPETVEQAYERLPRGVRFRVKALMPVHFAGLPCAMEQLTALADGAGWAVVDDAAHALPAARQGVPIGGGGDATGFSFYATKPLCTGEGGMVVTRRPEIAARMRVMRLHGIDHDAFNRYAEPDQWRYAVVAPGFKYNLTDIAAALGLSQLRRLHALRDRRAAVAATYSAAFAGIDGLDVPPDAPAGDEHAWHLYALRVLDGPRVRNRLVQELARLGIGTSVHFIPLHMQPYYRDTYALEEHECPAATRLHGRELSLPLFPDMTAEQVMRVIEAVPAALARARDSVGV